MLVFYAVRTGNADHCSREFSVFAILIGELCRVKRNADLFVMGAIISPVKL